MNAEHDVKPAWARLASWTAGLPAIALACAASGALAGTRPMDAYFDAQIAVAKKTIDACIAANEGTSSASGCDDEDKVFLPAFYPRIVAPIFSRIDLSSPSATLDKVQSGYAKEASQLTQLESTLSSAMQTRSHDQLAADLQGQVESAFQSVRSLAGSSGTLIDLYNIDSQKPLAGWRYGGAMIPYGALDTFALATAAQKIYDSLYNSGMCASGTLTGYAAGPGASLACTTPQYAGLLSVGIKINLWVQWSAGAEGFPKMALNGSQGRQALSVDFNNAVTIKASVEFDIYPPDPFPNQTASGKVQATVSGRAEVTNLSLDPLDASELVDKDGLNSRHVSYKIDVSYDLGGIDQILSQALSDLYDDITPVAVAFVGPLAALTIASDENSFHSKVTAWVNNGVKPAINKFIANAQDDLKSMIDGYVRQNYAKIESFNKDVKAAQSLLVGKNYPSNVFPNGGPRIDWATHLFDGPVDWFSNNDFKIHTSPSQELSSALELVMPEPQDNKGSLAATLVMPRTACNYDVRDTPQTGGIPGPVIPYEMVSYSPGPAPAPGTVPPGGGSVAVNADAAGKQCRDLLKANLIVTRYKGSKISQVDGWPESWIAPEWDPVDHYSVKGSTPLALTDLGDVKSYACHFTVKDLPNGAIVRLALAPHPPYGDLLERMQANGQGAGKADASVQTIYVEGGAGIGKLSGTQRGYLFRTAVVLPEPLAPYSKTVSSINNWLSKLNASIAHGDPNWLAQTLQAENGLLTLDERGVPQSNFLLGRPSVSDPAKQCASYQILINPSAPNPPPFTGSPGTPGKNGLYDGN